MLHFNSVRPTARARKASAWTGKPSFERLDPRVLLAAHVFGGAGYGSIQAAVNAAAPGGVINVDAGTYNENVLIDKSLTLVSYGSSADTIITGISGAGALGTIQIAPGVNDVKIGQTNHGFTIVGIDNGDPAVENAAVYLDDNHSNVEVVGNNVVANGDLGLLAEFGMQIDNLLVKDNEFSGQAFVGTAPAGLGFAGQWTLPNVPRQLVTISPSASSTVTFTNNLVSGTAGGINAAAQQQGNTLVTIDANNATITGNTFTGFTNRFAHSLRVRGAGTTVSGNTFSGTAPYGLFVGGAGGGMATGNTFNGVNALAQLRLDSPGKTASGNNFTGSQAGVACRIEADPAEGYDAAALHAANTFETAVLAQDALSAYAPAVFANIQGGMAAATANGTVSAKAGTYNEDVIANVAGLRLLGAGAGVTTVNGVVGGGSATVQVGASNVEVAGFTISRLGNNSTDWYKTSLNSAGVAVQGPAISGMLVHDNVITGNRSAIDVNDSSGHTIRNNELTNNRTGVIFRNQTDNITFTENDVADNWTVGILFLNAGGVPQSAANSTFTNNNISGNWYGQIVDRQSGSSLPAPGTTNLKNFSGNWFGTATPTISSTNSAELGYADTPMPGVFGGPGAPPAVQQPDICGPASANFDVTPLLASGADTDVETVPGRGTFGFQGSHATLNVTSQLAQTGPAGRIQEGVGMVTAGGTVNVSAGTYVEQVDIDKNLTLIGSGDATVIKAPDAMAGYAQGARNFKAVVNVHGTSATVKDLKVDGAGKGGANHEFAGIGVFDAGATIDNVTVTGVRNEPANGVQHGVAILARNTAAVARNVAINNSRVTDYQKGGIVVNDVAGNQITATITGNTATGDGPIDYIAENGIQLYNTTGGSTVSGNTVSGHDYTGSSASSAGLLLWEVRAGTVVSNNTTTGNNAGIYHISGDATISGNTITGNDWGVVADGGNVALSGNDFDDATADNDVDLFVWSPVSGVTLSGNQFAGDSAFIESDWAQSIDATGESFDETSNFRIEDKIVHKLDDASTGLVTWVANNVYVTTPGTGSTDSSIQRGVNAVAAGGTVNVEAGTYNENVDVTKSLTLDGAGSGAAGTVVTATGNLLTVSASGVTVRDIRLVGGARGVLVNGVSNTTLDSIAAVGNSSNGVEAAGTNANLAILNSTLANNPVGFRMGTAANLDGLTIDGSTFDGNAIGIAVFASPAGSYLRNVDISDTVFSNNSQKGMYFEKLSDATIERVTVQDSGTDAAYAFNNGIDINLKHGAYANIAIKDSVFRGSGVRTVFGPGGLDFAAAIAIKARDDGSYAAVPATLNNVLLSCNTFEDSATHAMTTSVRVGEPGKNNAGPTNVVIRGNDLSDGSWVGVHNTTLTQVKAEYNWWGSTSATTIGSSLALGSVDYKPFLLGKVADSLAYAGAGGITLIVNKANGQFLFTDATGTTFAGDDAKVVQGFLVLFDRIGKTFVIGGGDADGTIGIVLSGTGKPKLYKLTAIELC